MKQVVQNFKTGELKVDEVPSPTTLINGLLVKNQCSLISGGTEKSTIDMAQKSLVGKAAARPDLVKKVINQVKKEGLFTTTKMVLGRLDNRVALGYSSAGIVTEVGHDVSGFTIGDRVACAGQNYASHAEVVSVPINLCVKIPEGVDFHDACYIALGSIALQGVRQADPRIGNIVGVIGLGLLGQLTVQLLKAAGCKVLASDIDEKKVALAKELGADMSVVSTDFSNMSSSITQEHGVDSVIITASTKSNEPVTTASEVCRHKGRVVVVGAVGMDIPREPFYAKELELRISTSYGPGRYDPNYEEKGIDYPYGYVRWTEGRNMSAFLGFVAEGKVNLKPLTTHNIPIAEAEAAYKMITAQSEPYLGIVLNYPSSQEKKSSARVALKTVTRSQQVELGIIGAGNHVKDMLLPHIRSTKGVNVRAVCTTTGIHAKAVAQKESAEYCTSDYRELLTDPTINAVLIGTRHESHASLVIEALKHGKHVFLEKPLGLTEDEVERIEETYEQTAETKGLILQVGFNRSYSDHAQKIRRFFHLANNPLTMIYRVNAGYIPADHWIQDKAIGGGRMIGEGCHFIDFMRSVIDADVTSVFARSVGEHNSGIVEDKAIVTLTFKDGSIGTVVYSGDGDKALEKEYFEAIGDGKSVLMHDFMRTEFYSNGRMETFKTKKRDKGFKKEMEAFFQAIQAGDRAQPTFASIKGVTLATIYAMESMRNGIPYNLV